MLSPRVPGIPVLQNSTSPAFTCHVQHRLPLITSSEVDRPREHVWRFIVDGIRGKWGTAEKAKCRIFLCLFNKLLIMAGASGLREGVCFLPVVVDVIECSCRAFLHGVWVRSSVSVCFAKTCLHRETEKGQRASVFHECTLTAVQYNTQCKRTPAETACLVQLMHEQRCVCHFEQK